MAQSLRHGWTCSSLSGLLLEWWSFGRSGSSWVWLRCSRLSCSWLSSSFASTSGKSVLFGCCGFFFLSLLLSFLFLIPYPSSLHSSLEVAFNYQIDPVEFFVKSLAPYSRNACQGLPPCLIASQALLDKPGGLLFPLPPLSRYHHIRSIFSESFLDYSCSPDFVFDLLQEAATTQPASIPVLNLCSGLIPSDIG